MIEAFTADHKVSHTEVLYDWPASRFEAFYDAFARRKVADELNTRRSLEIAATWANTNLDSSDNKDARQNWQESIDRGFSIAIAKLYGDAIEDEDEIDKDDPFFAAMEKGMNKRKLPKPDTVKDIE